MLSINKTLCGADFTRRNQNIRLNLIFNNRLFFYSTGNWCSRNKIGFILPYNENPTDLCSVSCLLSRFFYILNKSTKKKECKKEKHTSCKEMANLFPTL